MKILFYEVRHSSPNFHEFTGSKTIFAKKSLAQKLEKFFFGQNPFQATIRLKKKKKSGMDH